MPRRLRASRIRLVLLAALLVLAAAAVLWTEVLRNGSTRPLAWRDLGRQTGQLVLPGAVSQVFRRRVELESFLRTARSGTIPPHPPVAFPREEAVIVATGPRSSTGYSLHVVSVVEQGSRVVVEVRERAPTLGDRVQAIVTYPYRLIAFRARSEPVFVTWLGRP